jgi:hypothetical protein
VLFNRRVIQSTIVKRSCLLVQLCYIVRSVSTSKSMIPRPCFQALHTVYLLFYYMFACSDFYSRLHLLLIIIYTTCISLSLCQTSAPIHLTSVLGVLGTQETFCIVIAGLLERIALTSSSLSSINLG